MQRFPLHLQQAQVLAWSVDARAGATMVQHIGLNMKDPGVPSIKASERGAKMLRRLLMYRSPETLNPKLKHLNPKPHTPKAYPFGGPAQSLKF